MQHMTIDVGRFEAAFLRAYNRKPDADPKRMFQDTLTSYLHDTMCSVRIDDEALTAQQISAAVQAWHTVESLSRIWGMKMPCGPLLQQPDEDISAYAVRFAQALFTISKLT